MVSLLNIVRRYRTPRECSILQAIYATLDDDQEHFILLVLNAGNEITGFKVIASGSQDAAEIDTRIVFHNALLLGARNIMVAHNHPSGSLKPSPADWMTTERIVNAGKIVGVDCIDHIIFTSTGCLSLREKNPDLFERAQR